MNSYWVILVLLIATLVFNAMCTHTGTDRVLTDAYGQVYAGDAACAGCHKDIYSGFIHTPHYLDSRPATGESIKGKFKDPRDSVHYHPPLTVMMERKDSQFIQAAYRNGKFYRSEPFDIVIGAGRKGQSYLYWKDEMLFQLPVSYFTPLDAWCNSPGYTVDTPYFDRRVPAQCLECHTTYAQTVFRSNQELGDRFDKSRTVYGVGCEKCHGPAAQHVAFHAGHPEEKEGKYILNAGKMTRRQRLDACAVCHSGRRAPLKPAFSFRVGDSLDAFSGARFNSATVSSLDVHGNQYGLLTSSKCFAATQMDCSTCHNVHVNDPGNLKAFSQRCITCHSDAAHNTCKMPETPGLVLADNCIDCHMPALPSQKIIMHLDSSRFVANWVRTHRIAIYPDATKTFLKSK